MKKIKKEALAHYDRMIEWAEKQEPEGFMNYLNMSRSISEMWGVEYCSYCNKYFNKQCGKCLLGHRSHCCDGLHEKMCSSKTWGTWVKRAKLVRQYIKDNG